MRTKEAKAASTADLIDIYAKVAAKHGAASLTGDYRTGNKNADIIGVVYRELRRRGPEAQAALLGLLDLPDPGVRTWAAAHALEFAPHKGIPVLESIAASEPWPLNTNAEMTLKVWEEGELKFP